METELEWIRSSAKGQQKKGKARATRYDELVSESAKFMRDAPLENIIIPTGPRLGDVVVNAKSLTKAYGDRLLIDNLNLDIPPGSIVGIIGANG